MQRVFLHTGSNQGDRLANLERAVAVLMKSVGTVTKASQIFETAAWGIRDQPDFLNQALEMKTGLDPIALLSTILNIEEQMGRVRVQKWGQRLIDIDMLYYGDLIWESDQLTLPHPHLQERNFVLAPLLDIAPDFVHPRLKKTTQELFAICKDALPARHYNVLG
ncbi:MAG: 2-amino-4-hydroxy-6-hydroxymethyldihydropteridine diphosphokinase [Phaeodactylibacter sp.]|uniref:2-amino-4-hydroxy-6- hydroxymethyldihydropteridine diphosphokinase n=1 Tax=Phaeodactylibacter sp. TaxID=1940289 RepID=UPI0032EC28CF